MSTGSYLDGGLTNADATQSRHGFILKGTLAEPPTTVTWTIDSTSLIPAGGFYKGTGTAANSTGYQIAGAPRLAFGPDGMHGYAVYIGRLATAAGNSSDSCMTPILFTTSDGGNTWAHVLSGYDWACNHPELKKNLYNVYANTMRDYYSFSAGFSGLDVTVDKNNMLHLVCTMQSVYCGSEGALTATSFYPDSASFSYGYDFDYVNYHPIIWDCMTDGSSGWKTLMVDSLLSAQSNGTSTDTTSTYNAVSSTSPDFLTIGAHLTVSRSTDGSKVFYGWADSPDGINLWVFNTNPDLMLRGYDVSTNMLTPAPSAASIAGNGDIYNLGYMFFPYIADVSYYDTTQSAWVVPAVYSYGRTSSISSLGFKVYDGTTTWDYYYTNCGTFAQSDFATAATVIPQVGGTCYTDAGIKTYSNNAFASSIENYPNPFNNTTTIAVTLTENKPVSIKVYNTLGDVVFTKTIDGNVGTNSVTFDGGQVSSGVYYYTVTSGNQQATKKMIIQK
jgi:hypothetical protein